MSNSSAPANAANTAGATAADQASADTFAEGRRGGLILLATGAVLTVLGVIVALVAGSDATVAIRRSEMGVWAILLPGVFGILVGIYGYTVRQAYQAKGAGKAFIVVSVLVALLFLRMAYSAF